MSAVVDRAGNVRQLDQKASADSAPTEQDIQDTSKLLRIVLGLLKDVAALKRAFLPRRLDFEGIAVDNTGATKYRFAHSFGGRVRWWPVNWVSGGSLIPGAMLGEHTDTTNDVLVLISYATGTVSIRVEESG